MTSRISEFVFTEDVVERMLEELGQTEPIGRNEGMTVAQLITALQAMPGDLPVCFMRLNAGGECWTHVPTEVFQQLDPNDRRPEVVVNTLPEFDGQPD